MKSIVQLVSQVPPASVEKACSQRQEVGVIRDQMNRQRIDRPSSTSSA
ncbi:hypothetical protein ACTMS0_28380 [Micromonospora sp. H33]